MNRVKMAVSMFTKFNTGTFNPRAFQAHRVRTLTQARGAKEGNNALIKDTVQINSDSLDEITKFCMNNPVSVELYEFVKTKFMESEPNQHRYERYWNIVDCVLYGNRKLAAYLIDKVLQSNAEGFNRLHYEVLQLDNSEDMKTTKIRANMCVKKTYMNDSITPIHCAAVNPNPKYLKQLLNISQEFNISDKKGRKPIHYAACSESPMALEYLMTRVSQYETDAQGNTPLHYACKTGRSFNAEVLLRAAQTKQDDEGVCTTEVQMDNRYGIGGINKPNRRGKCPLHLAIECNHHDCVKVLIKYGCNVEYQLSTSFGKMTPLMYATQLGYHRIVQLLREVGNARIEARDRYFRTAAMHACMCGNARTLSYLLRMGAKPNAFDSSGNSCLHYACAYGWYHCMKLLLDSGADYNHANDWKLTPFGVAFLKGHVGLCDQLLVNRTIDVNFRTENGETLVMLAASNRLDKLTVNQLDYIVNKLHGDCKLIDSDGNTALHYLAKNVDIPQEEDEKKLTEECRLQMADILLKGECNFNLDNNNGDTALFCAIKSGNIEFANQLIVKYNVNIDTRQDKEGRNLLHLISIHSLVKKNQWNSEERINAFMLFDDYENNKLRKHEDLFKKLADVEDTSSNTPFVCACMSLTNFFNDHSTEEDKSLLVVGFRNYMKILYENFDSNLNKKIEQKNSIINSTVNTSEKCSTTPVGMLINDNCCDLIEDLVKISQKKTTRKIDFEIVDTDDCTIIHKAIILKQIKLLMKLIELNCCNLEQKCLNKETYLNENLLQMCIRNRLFDIYDLILDKLYTNNTDKDFLLLIQQTNMHRQNMLHVLAGLVLDDRAKFSVQRLTRLFQHIKTRVQHDQQAYDSVCSSFLNAKDKYERTPLHLCMISRDCTLSTDTNIDLETFLIEQKADLFIKDCYSRMPLHYLFCNTFTNKNIETNNKDKKSGANDNKHLHIPNNLASEVIDPVELLTMLTSAMNYKSIDEPDQFGYTPLHYSSIRGATICCSHLIQHNCKILGKQQNNFNTPLSSAIYYGHKSCVLTLLKSISDQEQHSNAASSNAAANSNGNSTIHKAVIKDYHYIPVDKATAAAATTSTTDSNECENENDDGYIKWTPKLIERIKASNKVALYELILKNNWEGVSWLILSQLEDYGLRRLDTIVYAINACNYNLALRLIEKYERLDETMSFNRELLTQTVEHNRTLLHIICKQKLNNDLEQTKTNSLAKIIDKLLLVNNTDTQKNILRKKFYELKQLVNEFLYLKDEFNCTAIHYACVQHNYLIIDYLLNNFDPVNVLLAKDGKQQTAFSLLFWSIGKMKFTEANTKKISEYCEKLPGNFDMNNDLKAHYTLLDAVNFDYSGSGKHSISSDLYTCDDYPNNSENSLTCVSPLLYAINRQDVNMCKYLLNKPFNIDINICDQRSIPASVYAIRTNNINVFCLLLNQDYASDLKKKGKNKLEKKVSNTGGRIKSLFQTLPTKPATAGFSTPVHTVFGASTSIWGPKVHTGARVIQTARMSTGGKAPRKQLATIAARKATQSSDDDDDDDDNGESEEEEEEEEHEDEDDEDEENDDGNKDDHETSIQIDSHDIELNKFEIKSAINLFHLDSDSRSIFHHLACSLEYGSFVNTDICRLLLHSTKKNVQIDELKTLIKHLDNKSQTAIDYALRHGNLELADELKKYCNIESTDTDSLQQIAKLQKLTQFYVNDPYYAGPNAIPDYKTDSDELLRKHRLTSSEAVNDSELFFVDPLTNMVNTGELLWDKQHNTPYDCILTKTDIAYGMYGMHNFYKMQIVKQKFTHTAGSGDDGEESTICVLFTRWGRIGDEGQYQRTPFANATEAKAEFHKIFKQKTGNDFVDTAVKKEKQFEQKPKKYNFISFDIRRKHKLKDLQFELPIENMDEAVQFGETVECKIKNTEYLKLFHDLCDVDYLKKQSLERTHLSNKYLPLTRLSPQVIQQAIDMLKNVIKPLIDRKLEIEKQRKKENVNEYLELIDKLNAKSSDYYQLVPQLNYQFEKLVPISDEKEYDSQMSQLSQLADYQFAIKLLMGAYYSQKRLNPYDYVYNSLNCKLQYLKPNDIEAQYILRYIWASTEGNHTDRNRSIFVERIFKFERIGECERFEKVKLKNRMLLWHGTSTENMLSIMSKGLLKNPISSRQHGQRFGKGIYTSDMFAMSNSYAHGKQKNGSEHKYMLLCEVALGKVYEDKQYEGVDYLPDGYDSVKCMGRSQPNPKHTITLPNGCKIPLGTPIQVKSPTYIYDEYNQYVVYDESHACIRYIVQYRT